MIIKKKSLVVAFISSLIVASVMVLTLVGYLAYLQLKDEERKVSYQYLLAKVNAKVYSRYIEVSRLNAKMETSGPLKGNPVIEGVIRNAGYKNMADPLMKVKFLDKDGAVIYEVVFHPQEPSLGTGGLTQVTIPYLPNPSKAPIKPGDSLAFKKILANCPKEVASEMKDASGFARARPRWSGKFSFEFLSLDFPQKNI